MQTEEAKARQKKYREFITPLVPERK